MRLDIFKLQFRTYGTDRINKGYTYNAQRDSRNHLNMINKPVGLWSSPNDDKNFYTWKKWCISEDYKTDTLDIWVDFTIKPGSRVLMLTSEANMDWCYKRYGYHDNIRTSGRRFNWKLIEKDFDAVYFDSRKWSCLKSKYDFYCWDVDSLCVFNLNCICSKK